MSQKYVNESYKTKSDASVKSRVKPKSQGASQAGNVKEINQPHKVHIIIEGKSTLMEVDTGLLLPSCLKVTLRNVSLIDT
jgi:hypothetical protein